MRTNIRLLVIVILICSGLYQSVGQVPVLDWVHVHTNDQDDFQPGDYPGSMVRDREGNYYYIMMPRRKDQGLECGQVIVRKRGSSFDDGWLGGGELRRAAFRRWGATIGLDQSGNVYLTANYTFRLYGGIFGTPYFRDGINVWKLSAEGREVWNWSFLGDVFGLSTSSVGESMYVMAHFSGTVGGGFNLVSSGGNDMFLFKIGQPQLVVHYPNPYEETVSSVQIDNQSNLYVTGAITDTFTINTTSGTVHLISAGESDILVMKLDSSGNCIWAKQIGGTYKDFGIASIDSQGNIYVTGSFSGTVDFDPGPGTFFLTYPWQPEGAFILKLDTNGNFVWAKKVSEEASHGTAIAVSKEGNVYAAGNFKEQWILTLVRVYSCFLPMKAKYLG